MNQAQAGGVGRRKHLGLTVADMFCGAGGLSEGFRMAGYRIVAGTDNDPDAIGTYAHNFPNAVAVCGDIRDPAVRERVAAVASTVDVLVGGPPCQAFSQVRNHSRLIDDPRNSLYREFVQTVDHARPLAFLMENVPGMAQMGAKEQVEADLGLDGAYRVAPQLVDAADFGVPQTRKRLLFFGVRADLGVDPPRLQGTGAVAAIQLVRFPGTGRRGNRTGYAVTARPDEGGESLALRLANSSDMSVVSVEQAISDRAGLEAGRRDEHMAADELARATSAYQRVMRTSRLTGEVSNVSVPRGRPDTVMRLAGIPAGGNHRDLSDELLARYLTGDKWGPSNGTGRLGRAHYYAYRRLHPDIWAWTLNTKGDSAYHYRASRSLSVREFARLQSFPDGFWFTTDPRRGELPGRIDGGAAHSRYRQAGNAVPPLLAAAAARALRATLDAACPPLRELDPPPVPAA